MTLQLRKRSILLFAAALVISLGAWQSALAVQPVHAEAGVVKKVDAAAKTIVIETADGTEKVFKYTGHTTVEGLEAAGKGVKKGTMGTYHGGIEGSHAVIHYTRKGSDNVAVGVKDLGNKTVKVSDGTIDHVDKDTHTLTVKARDGTRQTYQLSKNTTIDTSQGVVNRAKWAYKKGDKVTVHYTDEAGKKVADFIHHL